MIVGLLFAATVINYIDRQMIGVLKPTLMDGPRLDARSTTPTSSSGSSRLRDRLYRLRPDRRPDRRAARLCHRLRDLDDRAHRPWRRLISVTQFALARFGLGIGEAGNFPAGIKAVTEWFPARERAFAIGMFNAGANIGAIVTPLVVPLLVVAYGWRAAFVITGVAAFVWLIAWLAMYRRPREHKRVSAAELA